MSHVGVNADIWTVWVRMPNEAVRMTALPGVYIDG
jgi:hypothetical protein